ncbi:MAG TPA: hypothetical protein VM070_07475 [Candidatus Saccharimonadales bacterium]|nr:hypothetical protein [Candidatus Saccharimonadales bacterium]
MDTVNFRGDDGQALVIAVLGIGIAAVTIVGLRDAQDRILAEAHARRAGEAAVEAAGAALADAQAALITRVRAQRGRAASLVRREELAQLISDPAVIEAALAAARELAAENRAGAPTDLLIRDVGADLEVLLTVDRRRHRAAIGAACCRP